MTVATIGGNALALTAKPNRYPSITARKPVGLVDTHCLMFPERDALATAADAGIDVSIGATRLLTPPDTRFPGLTRNTAGWLLGTRHTELIDTAPVSTLASMGLARKA